MTHSFCTPHIRRLNQLSNEEKLCQRHLAETHLAQAIEVTSGYLRVVVEEAAQPREIAVVISHAMMLACVCRCHASFAEGSVLYHYPQEVLLACLPLIQEHANKKTARVWTAFVTEFFDGTLSAGSRGLACDVIDVLFNQARPFNDPQEVQAVAHCVGCLTPVMRKSLNSQRRRGGLHISG